MADFEAKPGTAKLFRNNKKEYEKQPDFSGSMKDFAGKTWRLAGWLKDGKAGKYLSLSMSEMQTGSQKAVKDDDNSLPF